MNYAVIDPNGLIVNRIVLDDLNSWRLPAGYSIQQEPPEGFNIGGTYINGNYNPPVNNSPAPVIIDAVDSWDIMSLKLAFNHENRIRALEGKAALTLVQFKTAVRAML